MAAPPESVKRAFGAEGEASALPGGQGTAWQVGDIVLKPLDMPASELEWQESVLSVVGDDQVRVAAPLRSRGGALVVDGWTGWPLLEGRHGHDWTTIIDAGERLHAALADVPRPSRLLDAREHHWARADRVAWGEAAGPERAADSSLESLLAARRPVSLPDQLIHGDLSGNVLLTDSRPPAVIDFSPYWRPKAYATAIILVDAVVWHEADGQLLDLLDHEQGTQLLVRAAIFRMLSDSDPATGHYDALLRRLRGRLSGDRPRAQKSGPGSTTLPALVRSLRPK